MNNIFNILSAGNKELVHSSMIKLFCEIEEFDFIKKFLDIDTPDDLKIQIEKSDKVGGEKIRFDLLGVSCVNNEKVHFLIENKFKATPSVKQLEIYDKTRKNITKKFLMVFHSNQVPSDVRIYCEQNGWELRSYFSDGDSENQSLLSFLSFLKVSDNLAENLKLLILEYTNYLKSIHEDIQHLKNNSNYITDRQIDEWLETNKLNGILNRRELKFQYLLYIQSTITAKLIFKRSDNITSNNDGGKNNTPSVALWKKSENIEAIDSFYFAIDGDTMKVGVLYKRKDISKVKVLINSISENFLKNQDLTSVEVKDRLSSKLKEKDASEKLSVFSLYTFKIKENRLKSDVVEDALKIITSFFGIKEVI